MVRPEDVRRPVHQEEERLLNSRRHHGRLTIAGRWLAVYTGCLLLAPTSLLAQAGGTPPTAGAPPPILAGRVIPLAEGAGEANEESASSLPETPAEGTGSELAEGRGAPPEAVDSLDLNQLIERARVSDMRVLAAREQLAAFEARHDEARWAWFPSFGTTMIFGGPVPEARVVDNPTSPLDITEASREGDYNFGRMGVLARVRADAALPVFTFGKLDGLDEAMARLVDLGEAEVVRMEHQAAFDAARAYYGYQTARQAAASLDEAIRQATKARARIQKLLDAESEQVTVNDILMTDLLIQHIEVQRSRVLEAQSIALAAVALLAGTEEAGPPEVLAETLRSPPAPPPLARMIDSARAQRPELRAVAAARLAREQEVEIRKAMFYPDFLVGGYAEWSWSNAATDQRNPFVYDPYNYVTAGAGLLVRQTFDIPQKSARLRRVEAERRKLLHQEHLLEHAVGLEVEKAWRELDGALERAEQLSEAERTARRWVVAALANFEIGLGGASDVLEPIAAHAATLSARTNAIYSANLARAALAKAIGTDLRSFAE